MKQNFSATDNNAMIDDSFDESDNRISSSNALLDLSAFEKYLSLKRILIAVAILLFLIAWNRGVALLYAMDALIIATLIVAWLVPKFNISKLHVTVSLPDTANEGDEVPLTINTQSHGFFNRYLIELWGDFPFSSENRKNMKLINSVGKPQQHIMNIPCDLRGHYTLKSFKLKTGFPIGLISAEKEIILSTTGFSTNHNAANTTSILIYPTPLPTHTFEVARDPSQSALQEDNNPKAGGHDDYIAVREYRHGDSPRHIHWPSSAKRGELVVREFQQNNTTHLTIILDLNEQANTGKGKHSTLEYAIKITASLIKYALEHQYSFSVFGLGKEPFEIKNNSRSPSVNALEDALEALAWLQAQGSRNYAQAVRQHLDQSRRGGTIVLFDHQNTTSALLPELQAQYYYPVIYRFDSASFNDDNADNGSDNKLENLPEKNESNTMTLWQISKGCKLEALFT